MDLQARAITFSEVFFVLFKLFIHYYVLHTNPPPPKFAIVCLYLRTSVTTFMEISRYIYANHIMLKRILTFLTT